MRKKLNLLFGLVLIISMIVLTGCVPARLEMDSYQKGAIAHVKQSYL